jgi:hypothetical protein
MIDIVICVDGTNSQEYKNRSVENFCRSVHAQVKIYRPGPQKGATGSDWAMIRDEVIREMDIIAKMYGEESFFNGYECTIAQNKRFRFIMVGHSRGGHIVINLAAMLKYRTHFMGLYDAVDRTNPYDIHQKMKIYNVDHIYHAIRDVSVGSRTSKKLQMRVGAVLVGGLGLDLADYGIAKMLDFDNTGLGSGDGGEYMMKSFKTSHGGIGGDVLTHKLVSVPVVEPLLADDSCAITMFNQGDVQVKKMELCLSESAEADRFVRSGARKNGVKI